MTLVYKKVHECCVANQKQHLCCFESSLLYLLIVNVFIANPNRTVVGYEYRLCGTIDNRNEIILLCQYDMWSIDCLPTTIFCYSMHSVVFCQNGEIRQYLSILKLFWNIRLIYFNMSSCSCCVVVVVVAFSSSPF